MTIVDWFVTGRVITVATIGGFAIGVPLIVLGASALGLKPNSRAIWFYAPLAGSGTIILVCQNLLYLDVPVVHSAVLVWLGAAIGWGLVLGAARFRSVLLPLPTIEFGLGLAVYLVHASGLLVLGASHYYGYGWDDMFNYVAQAQFFADWPFHNADITPRFLRAAHLYKQDRIGQSVLHAFMLVSSRTDAQQSFGATILLSPYLTYYALRAMGDRLGMSRLSACIAATAGGLTPAIATIHLECFFSQAMCLPFIYLWPIAVGWLTWAPSWRSALVTGLLLAVIASIYSELVPILVSVAAVCAATSEMLSINVIRSRLPIWVVTSGKTYPGATTFWLLVALVLAVISNPGFTQSAFTIMSRTLPGEVLAVIYPWAFKFEGLARLWVGDQVTLQPVWIGIFSILTVALIASNLVTLGIHLVRHFSGFFLALVLLMLVPAGPLVLGKGMNFGYQFYKLLLIVAPLHVFWLLAGAGHWARLLSEGIFRRVPRYTVEVAGYSFAVAFAVVGAVLVFNITFASSKAETVATTHRGGAYLMIDPDMQRVKDILSAARGRDVYLLWRDDDLYLGSFRTAWLEYAARYNDVFPLMATISVHTDPLAATFTERLAKHDLSHASNTLVVSWKASDELRDHLLYASSRIFVYEGISSTQLKSMIDASVLTIKRNLELRASETRADRWYPIWVAGRPSGATLLTINFGAVNHFRYDHWGYPAVHLDPGGDCRNKSISLQIEVNPLDKRIRLVCNGVSTEAELPVAETLLGAIGPDRFGVSPIISQLEGKYPLDPVFPGAIVESH
jgi:hypothetical protein